MIKPLLSFLLSAGVLVSVLANANAGHSVSLKKFDPVELEHFIDGVWESQSESHKAVGGIVTVVTGSEVLLNKGYGFSDIETRTPVDPEKTMFRIASISKTFTWIAVMQLVQQDLIDLDADINQYLTRFQIPNTYPQAITMRHLMSHNAGFEDVVLDLGRRSADDLLPLGEYLSSNLPKRVRAPGWHSSYSNHSTALAAHIVEEVSGQDWFSYIEDNLLTPLSMTNTSARHPMSKAHREQLSSAYFWVAGGWKKYEFLHWFIYPAGMMSTSGGDMVSYMQAQLNEDVPMLDQATFQRMLEPIYRPFPEANAWLHGFNQRNRNGINIYGHGGDLNGFHSTMMIFPEYDLGLFVSFNSDPASSIRSNLANAFIDHYFPKPAPNRAKPKKNAAELNHQYHGNYGRLRRDFSDFAKLTLLLGAVGVSTNSDGYLTVSSNSQTRQYVQIAKDRFGARYDAEQILFVRDDNGQVTHLEFSGYAAASMDKLAFIDNPQLHQFLFAIVALSSLYYLFYWPIRALRKRYYSAKAGGFSRLHYVVSWILALATVYGIANLVQGLGDESQFYFEIPEHIENLLLVLFITCLGLVINGIWLAISIVSGKGSFWERLNFGFFALSGLLYVFLSYYWNTLTYYL